MTDSIPKLSDLYKYDKKVFTLAMDNINYQYGYEKVKRYIKKDMWLDTCFLWENSKEGHDYWYDIEEKLIETYY